MTKDDVWLLLNHIFYLKAGKLKKILPFFDNDPLKIINTDPQKLEKFIGNKLTNYFSNLNKDQYLKEIYKNLEKFNISFITLNDENYPLLLKEIYDPPIVIFYKGKPLNKNFWGISIVGARLCTNYGKELSFSFSKKLAEQNIPIVSGMARGIDTKAHEGALNANANTVAVFGCGLDFIYPKENNKLAEQITKNGTIVSEFPPLIKPLPIHFPFRNRIISGLTKGTLIVEAASKSGSLITASCALDQDRLIWAIPGRLKDKTFSGCNLLIQMGAKLVTNEKDILEDLSLSIKNINNKTKKLNLDLSKNEKMVWDILIDNDEMQFDSLCDQIENLSPQQISYILLKFELKKIIKRLPGDFITTQNFI